MRLSRRLWPRFWSSSARYTPIATSSSPRNSGLPLSYDKRRCTQPRRLIVQRTIYACAAILTLLSLGVLSSGIPPSYSNIWHYEKLLPQHNLTEALVQNRRYLRIPNRVTGHGLNNVLQESVLLSYLAYRTQRALVFEDYTWSHSLSPYVIYDFSLRPSRLPLNAFISGPSAGGAVPPGSERAVNAAFWESICPAESRHTISSADQPKYAEGNVLFDWWMSQLGATQERCVEIDSRSQPVFDHNLFGGPQILSLWEGFSKSPILADFAWSRLVESALNRNLPIIQPGVRKYLSQDGVLPSTFSNLVAVHIRRGDFKRHCYRMVGWSANYMGFNRFPQFLDTFNSSFDEDQHARIQYYLQHCLPSVEQIVEKLRIVRRANPHLKEVYVLTNGWRWWLNGLKAALLEDGWDDMKSSLDLTFDPEQKHVAMAVDMAIAEKAEVFIGNGFSSLTSNIMMLRVSKDVDPSTNRLL
ncbi:hypothetical protein BDZ94DRAFT_1202166 [Collybia nuda]|uniref:Uncharacterized protein n=1 Tax=Collybia nuda TaxID=64659 RepID=A0A9P6CA16_9AGAR|nr:hypothetical protein BDZ94DRAFT_1202166 [Collybia nuda]